MKRRALKFAAICALVLGVLAFSDRTANAEDRALLIGIGHYADPALAGAASDAAARDLEAVSKLLTSKLGFSPGAIRVLRDDAATGAAILDNIGTWLLGAGPGEQIYFYFSGLGYFQKDVDGDEKDGLDETLIPHDAQLRQAGPSADISGMITDDQISAALAKFSDRRITVVLDTSHSGVVSRGKRGSGSVNGTRSPQFGGNTRAIVVEPAAQKQKAETGFVEAKGKLADNLQEWSAASGSQTALVDKSGGGSQGAFTKFYTEGLGGRPTRMATAHCRTQNCCRIWAINPPPTASNTQTVVKWA